MARFLKNIFSWTIRHLKRKILEGQEFQGGADEKMRRMRLGQVLDGAGLPPLQAKIKDINFKSMIILIIAILILLLSGELLNWRLV